MPRTGARAALALPGLLDGRRPLLPRRQGQDIGTAAKAAIDIGLTRPFPSIREARLEKDLLERYPGYAAVRLFRDEGRALAAAQASSVPSKGRGRSGPSANSSGRARRREGRP